MAESEFSLTRVVWTWSAHCMVVALLVPCLKSMGEMSGMDENNDSSVAFGMMMLLAGVDCLSNEGRSLWESLD